LGEKYAELYFTINYIKISNITKENIAKIINEFLNSKLSYGLFKYYNNIKDKPIPYIV
jgi:disulfide oxidoreductase YuzD